MIGSSLLLLGQAATPPAPDGPMPTWALITGLVLAGVVLLVLVPTVLGLRHARRHRELGHAERMRALELGHPLPGSEATASYPPGMTIGLWVPIAVFGIAFVGSQSGRMAHEGWVAAAVVGTTAVICGTVLTLRHGGATPPPASPPGKPRVDPAAYEDLAERR